MKSSNPYFILGICIAIGAGVGVALHNIAIGAGVGAAIGAGLIGTTLHAQRLYREAKGNLSKEGFDIPTHHWFRTVLQPLLLETLNERNVRESGILSWPAVEGIVRAHLDRRANLGYHLWGLVVLFLWMKQWGITAPSHAEERPEIPLVLPTSA